MSFAKMAATLSTGDELKPAEVWTDFYTRGDHKATSLTIPFFGRWCNKHMLVQYGVPYFTFHWPLGDAIAS